MKYTVVLVVALASVALLASAEGGASVDGLAKPLDEYADDASVGKAQTSKGGIEGARTGAGGPPGNSPPGFLQLSPLPLPPRAAGMAAGKAAAYVKLIVSHGCASGAPIYFAASWVPYGSKGFKVDGWWKLKPCTSVYFANTTNRYFYLYAYSNTCSSNLYWSGNTRLAFRGSYYKFIEYNVGPKIINSYTVTLTCPNLQIGRCCKYSCRGGQPIPYICA